MIIQPIEGLPKPPPSQVSGASQSADQAPKVDLSPPQPAVDLDRVEVSQEAARQAVRESVQETTRAEPREPIVVTPPEQVAERISLAIDTLSQRFTNVNFNIGRDSAGQVIVNVVGKESGELVRQIPSEEVLRLRENLESLRGVVFNNVT